MQDTTTTSCTRDFKVICNTAANKPPVDDAKIRATADQIAEAIMANASNIMDKTIKSANDPEATVFMAMALMAHCKQVRHAMVLQSRRRWPQTFNWPSLRLNTGMWLYVEPVRYRSRGG